MKICNFPCEMVKDIEFSVKMHVCVCEREREREKLYVW
jgi:hypothetical protein